MICPDFTNSGLEDDTWKLKGSVASFVIKRGEFVVERCRNETYCETDENINKFISDLVVDTWVFQEKIDYLKYLEKPVYQISEFVSGTVLNNPEKIVRNIVLLRKHDIDTEDSYFQIG